MRNVPVEIDDYRCNLRPGDLIVPLSENGLAGCIVLSATEGFELFVIDICREATVCFVALDWWRPRPQEFIILRPTGED